MSDDIDRATEVINRSIVAQVRGEMIELVADDGVDFERRIAQALARAGLLASPERDARQREIGAAGVTDLIRASAIGSRARGDSQRERTLLELLTLIERTKP